MINMMVDFVNPARYVPTQLEAFSPATPVWFGQVLTKLFRIRRGYGVSFISIFLTSPSHRPTSCHYFFFHAAHICIACISTFLTYYYCLLILFYASACSFNFLLNHSFCVLYH